MVTIKEADHLMSSAPDEDVKIHTDEGALSERIFEWLETPEGSIADHPSWGHNLTGFQFDPESSNLAVRIEMAITAKLARDVQDMVMLGVRVDFIEIDLCRVVIRHQFGNTTKELRL